MTRATAASKRTPAGPAASGGSGPAALVNPLIGTAGAGNVFPGADAPFGMLQWSPDTTNPADGGGYSASSSEITGFSLTHVSGLGCPGAGDVPILPTTGAIDPDAQDGFRRGAQAAQAGYYGVRLADGIGVQLTATTRSGLAEFSFPAGDRGNLIFKLDRSRLGDSAVRFIVASPTQVEGAVTTRSFCGLGTPYTLYFVMRFSRAADRYGTFTSAAASGQHPEAKQLTITDPGKLQAPTAAAGQPALATPAGGYVSFAAGAPVLAKVGISYVSAAGAVANLATEDPGWDFTAIRSATQRAWNDLLGKITVTSGTRARRVVFYTALYHSLLAPVVFSDVDRQYIGADGKVHTVDAGQAAEYTDFSNWDIYRTQAQLEALLDPAAASGAAQSLLDAYRQTGMLPKWPADDDDSYTMVGDPADAVLADYYAFGARGFDAPAALAAMITQATRPSNVRPGLAYLSTLGYLPNDGSYGCCNYHGSVSTTLEYNTDDFAISAMAAALGDRPAEQAFRQRAQDWQHLLDPATGFMQPRLADGAWRPGFSPTSPAGFVEGDSWQYTGMVPFDVAGLTDAKGGRTAMARYLDAVLASFTAGFTGASADLGNEPSFELPWEYDYIGEPAATQRTVRAIQDALWLDAPDGLPGNDDLGAMSAWFVWSALGLYPMTPGTATLALGSPLFISAVIRLPSGHDLRIEGAGAATDAPYVQSAAWDGQAFDHAYAPSGALATGGTLSFRLGTSPSGSWAAAPADAPPSYGAPATSATRAGWAGPQRG
ncbi:MAG TPA: lectin [Streptosporangiaceae bacterium]